MKIIEKIKGLFTCGKEDGTIKLNNRLVQEDLYEFLNYDIRTIFMTMSDEFKIVIKIDDNNSLSYPYESKKEMEEDYLELRRIIKKLK